MSWNENCQVTVTSDRWQWKVKSDMWKFKYEEEKKFSHRYANNHICEDQIEWNWLTSQLKLA